MDEPEIEAPSSRQVADARAEEMVEFAAGTSSEVDVVARLVATGVPLDEAKEIAPTIMRASRRRRFRKRLPAYLIGGFLIACGGFFLVAQIIKGRFHPGPALMIIAGVAIATGYVKVRPEGSV